MEHKMTFEFINVKIPDFNPEFFRLWVNDVVMYHKKEVDALTWVFCNDEYLLEMNQEYLQHDYYTDIITFNYNEGNSLSGDLFISWERIKENAALLGVSEMEELSRVMIHGVLHLIGFDDKSEEDQTLMTKMENEMLSRRKSFT